LAHRCPHIGVDGIDAIDGLEGVRQRLDRAAATRGTGRVFQPIQVAGEQLVAVGGSDSHVHADHHRRHGQRAADVVGVADVGQ